MTDQVVVIIYICTLLLSTGLLLAILFTGAFFSLSIGAPLSAFGFLLSVANLIGLVYSENFAWYMALPGMILAILFVLLFIASLGGEK